jgi:hypothetical protein
MEGQAFLLSGGVAIGGKLEKQAKETLFIEN